MNYPHLTGQRKKRKKRKIKNYMITISIKQIYIVKINYIFAFIQNKLTYHFIIC